MNLSGMNKLIVHLPACDIATLEQIGHDKNCSMGTLLRELLGNVCADYRQSKRFEVHPSHYADRNSVEEL